MKIHIREIFVTLFFVQGDVSLKFVTTEYQNLLLLPPLLRPPSHITEHILGKAEVTSLLLVDPEVFQFFAAINNPAVNILILTALHMP